MKPESEKMNLEDLEEEILQRSFIEVLAVLLLADLSIHQGGFL